MNRFLLLSVIALLIPCPELFAQDAASKPGVAFRFDFEAANALDDWLPSQADRWTISDGNGGKVLHLLGKSGAYKPPVRSPHSISLLKNVVVGDFVITGKVRTLQTTRGHRDMCLFFGYQDPSKFYYVHLGETPDPHSSQIFIVNDAARKKITESKDVGIPWKNDVFHEFKLERSVSDGRIAFYFDDMETPQKVAHDKTFKWGMIGLGSFDDLGQWDDLSLNGSEVSGMTPKLFTPAATKKE